MADGIHLETGSLTGLHWLAILLSVVTGVIHLVLGVSFAPSPLGVSFLLAGVGFLVAVALVLVDVRRRQLYLLGIPFTALQVVLYFVVNWPDVLSPVGVADKVAQVVLVAALVVLYRRGE
jgi:hypothetical protein